MKMKVEWHQECLSNMYKTIEREKKRIAELQKQVAELSSQTWVYKYQIDEAIRMGKDGFDSERFKMKELTELRKFALWVDKWLVDI